MILRKPYAFIIKHFRIIHLLTLIPMIYLVMKTKAIVGFFSSYVSNGYQLPGNIMVANLSSSYINIFMYLAIILILIVFVVMDFILQNKKKPTKFYNASILYYIILFVILTLSLSIFQNIEADSLDNTLARVVRDLAFMIHYSEYFFIIFTLVRGVGFNIKKFNFKGDLEDLKISSEDNEEFEFLIGKDSYKTKRTIRRFFRELKYYYKENKFIFLVIFIIIVGVVITTFYTRKEVYNKVFNENDSIALGYLNFKINKSYITDLDLNGNVINKDKKYLILQLQISNRYRDDYYFSYTNLQLNINKLYISPDLSKASYFTDIGNPYNGTVIKGNSEAVYILVYEMDKYLVMNDVFIKAYSNYDGSKGGIGLVNRNIKINPTNIVSNINSNKVSMGSKVSFNNTNLGKSEVSINDYLITNRFTYNKNGYLKDIYIDLVRDVNQTLMVLDYNLALDTEADYMLTSKTYKTFFEDFLQIKYMVDNKEYTTKVKLLNPSEYSDKLIFKVNKAINDASSIEAVITVRNISYSFKLK